MKSPLWLGHCPDEFVMGAGVRWLKHNGPAIKGGCVTWRSHPATDPGTLARKLSWWQDRYGTCFCSPGTDLVKHYECRGTSLIGAENLSPVTNLVGDTGAVSRYKVDQA